MSIETPTSKTASKPYAASLSPESAAHSEALKADLLRTLLRIGLLSTAAGAGTGLLTHYLGRQSIKLPSADDPDVELPYPQKQGSFAPQLVAYALAPPVFAGIHGLAGAASTPDDPIAGATYGALGGIFRGVGTAGGAAGGAYLGSKLPYKFYGGSGRAGALIAALLGGWAGNVAAGAAAKPLLRFSEGPPPWSKDREKQGLAPQLAAYALAPPVFAGIHGLAGAASTPDDPIAGATYGALGGIFRGVGTAGGAAGGAYLGSKLPYKLYGGSGRAGALIAALLGGWAGNVAAGAAAKPLLRFSEGPPPWSKDREKQGDWADAAVKSLMPTPAGEPAPTAFGPRWFRGDAQTTAGSIPWAIPGTMAAGLGGLYGGHHLIRWLLRKKKKHQLEKELHRAEQDYEAAMLGQYDPERLQPLEGKAASAGDRLDALYQIWQTKQASFSNVLGKGTGAYLLLAGLLGGGTGLATYNYLQGRSKAKMLEKAIKHRALLRGLANPPDVYLRPVPAREEKSRHREHVSTRFPA